MIDLCSYRIKLPQKWVAVGPRSLKRCPVAEYVRNPEVMFAQLRFVAPPTTSFLLRLPPWKILTTLMQLGMRFAPAWLLRPFILSFVTTYLAPEPAVYRDIALGPVCNWVVLTDGGLAITTNHEVVKENGQVIPGLFAAGSAGQGGLLLEGHGHHLGWAFTSGRRAGRNATAYARQLHARQGLL